LDGADAVPIRLYPKAGYIKRSPFMEGFG